MKIKDPLRRPLYLFVWYVEKDRGKCSDHRQAGEPRKSVIGKGCKFFHGGYSRTTCAKISHPVTTKITSKASSTRSHTPDHSIPASRAPVTFTAAINKGTSKGKSMSGNNTSRAPVRTAIAANKVPRAEKPTMPRSKTSGNASKDHDHCTPSRRSESGVTTSSTKVRKSTFPRNLARNSVLGSNGHNSNPERQPRSCSTRNARCKLSIPANSNVTHSSAALTSAPCACSGLKAKTNTKTMSSARTNRDDTRSLVRSSRRTSFHSKAHIVRSPESEVRSLNG